MLKSAYWYLLANIGFDTAENEPAKIFQILQKKMPIIFFANFRYLPFSRGKPAEAAALSAGAGPRRSCSREPRPPDTEVQTDAILKRPHYASPEAQISLQLIGSNKR